MAKKAKRSKASDESTKHRILSAATELMADQGYAGTSISQIAKLSGANHASIYWAFESKEGLLASVIGQAAEAYFQLVAETAPASGDVYELIGSMGEAFRQGADHVRLIYLLALEVKDSDPAVAAAVQRVRAFSVAELDKRFVLVPDIQKHPRRDAISRQLAAHTLMLLDGLFLAGQTDMQKPQMDASLDFIVDAVRAFEQRLVSQP